MPQLAVGRVTGRSKGCHPLARSEAHRSVRDVQLGNRNVGGSLLEEKPCVDPKADAANSLNWWLDRLWTSLAPPISVALETEVSIVKDRSPSEKALDGCPQHS